MKSIIRVNDKFYLWSRRYGKPASKGMNLDELVESFKKDERLSRLLPRRLKRVGQHGCSSKKHSLLSIIASNKAHPSGRPLSVAEFFEVFGGSKDYDFSKDLTTPYYKIILKDKSEKYFPVLNLSTDDLVDYLYDIMSDGCNIPEKGITRRIMPNEIDSIELKNEDMA